MASLNGIPVGLISYFKWFENETLGLPISFLTRHAKRVLEKRDY